jgi:hypothetical protein
MKRLKTFMIVQIVIIAPFLLNPAQADNSKACYDLFRPVEKQSLKIKDNGGIWELFENGASLRKHSIVGLHLDSKITSLIDTINYLCEYQEGLPMTEVTHQVVPMMRKIGREDFIAHYLALNHSIEVIEVWAKYAEYFEANHKRKLDFNQTKNTLAEAQKFFKRYLTLAQHVGSVNEKEVRIKSLGLLVPLQSVEGIAEGGKALTEDIKQFIAMDPLLKQANLENAEIPYAPYLTGSGE